MCKFYSRFPYESIRAVSSATHVKPHSYVSEFRKYGRIKGVDICSGDAIFSSYSKHLSAHHLYFMFHGSTRFALIVGEFHGSPIAVYVPEADILVSVSTRYAEGSPELAWLCDCIDSHDFIDAEIDWRDHHRGSHTVSLLLGFMSNLGHYFWQDISGLAALIETRTSRPMGLPSEIYFPSWLDWPLPGEIFPELSDIPVIRCTTFQEARTLANSANRVAMRFPGIAIKSETRAFIYNSMVSAIGYHKFSSIASACQSHDYLWINLRSHNKAWMSQVSGLASIVNSMFAKFPRFAIYLDGMPNTRNIAEQLKLQIVPGVQVRDGIDSEIRESIVWANNVKAYISVVGSGLVLNSWLSTKPGFAHANKAHLAQSSFWGQASEACIMPAFLSPEDLVEDSDEMYGCYDFDWRVAYEYLSQVFC
jgi:hypothetical protein